MTKRMCFRSLLIILFIGLTYQLSNAQVPYQRVNGTVVGISGRLSGRSFPFSLIISRLHFAG